MDKTLPTRLEDMRRGFIPISATSKLLARAQERAEPITSGHLNGEKGGEP